MKSIVMARSRDERFVVDKYGAVAQRNCEVEYRGEQPRKSGVPKCNGVARNVLTSEVREE